METFPAKINWERPRKRKNKKKSFLRVRTRPVIENYKKKKAKKFKKLKNTIIASSQAKISWERPRKRKKQIVPMSSFPTRNRKFQKIAKQFKKLKTTILATFEANISWERPRKKEKKNHSDEFLPDP